MTGVREKGKERKLKWESAFVILWQASVYLWKVPPGKAQLKSLAAWGIHDHHNTSLSSIYITFALMSSIEDQAMHGATRWIFTDVHMKEITS